MNKKAFISYSGKDRQYAEKVCELLEITGVPCWMAPRDISPGGRYGEEIICAIEDSQVLVLLLSKGTNESRFVPSEVERAFSKGKAICTFRLEDVQPARAVELFVASSQWVDGWEPPMEARVKGLASSIAGGKMQVPDPSSPAPKEVAAKSEFYDVREAVDKALGEIVINKVVQMGGASWSEKNGFAVWGSLYAQYQGDAITGLISIVLETQRSADDHWKAIKLLGYAIRTPEGRASVAELPPVLVDYAAFAAPVLRHAAKNLLTEMRPSPVSAWTALSRVLPSAPNEAQRALLQLASRFAAPETRVEMARTTLDILHS